MELKRKYGLLTAICMVVGIVIGSGVFFKAQTILQKTSGNMPLGILAWIIGGAIMLFCILAFSSMATRYEKVNGVVDYAEATVSKKYAYFVGWFMTIIYYPTLTSVLAWLTARYTLVAMNLSNVNVVAGSECFTLMMFFLVLSYTVNALSPKLAGKVQVSTTFIKLIPLALMAVVGIIFGLVNQNGQLVENFTTVAASTTDSTGKLLLSAVCATAFAYEGWIIATSINAELRDAKRNLPKALLLGGIIVVAVYIAYYIGVAGGASNQELMDTGASTAFTNVFGNVFGTILNVFVAVSCFGTLNGLMLGCCRGMFSIAARGRGPAPKVFSQVDKETNMPTNSSVIGLLLCAIWGVYWFGAVVSPAMLESHNWFGKFSFDASELPIITIYAMYLPIFINFMRKAKDLSAGKRIVIPVLAICGSIFMMIAAVLSHGMGVVFYLVVFAVVMCIGALFSREVSLTKEPSKKRK